jgi:hypothetical protein
MSVQMSVAMRNSILDAYEAAVGASAKLQLRTGAPPANCAAADTGTLLCEIALPADWAAAAASGSKAKSGTWSGTGAAAGTAGHWRLKDNAGTTTHMQGTVTATGGGGDLTMDNPVLAVGQSIVVNTFTWNAAYS